MGARHLPGCCKLAVYTIWLFPTEAVCGTICPLLKTHLPIGY